MKIKSNRLPITLALLTLSAISSQSSTAHAQGTAFTYQGRLNSNGIPASGLYDFRFKLEIDALGNTSVGSVLLTNAIPVTNGLFATTLDFGAGIFNGSNYWLEVDVRTNNPANTLGYTALLPLQAVTPAPYAIFAGAANSASNLLGNIPVAQLSGTVPLAQLPVAVVTNNEANVTLGNVVLDDVTVNYGLYLPYPPAIYSGLAPFTFLSNDDNENFFAGINAGANTFGSYGNTGIGETALFDNTGGSDNTAVGMGAMNQNTTGNYNVAVGSVALENSTNENGLVAIGYEALQNDHAGGSGFTTSRNGENTAVGFEALQSDTTGYGNTAIGYLALNQNTNGYGNTAIGDWALNSNANGHDNTANGFYALYNNTIGTDNTANGHYALYNNKSGGANTADGSGALYSNTNGIQNTASGYNALVANTSGSYNTADGFAALEDNTTGSGNTALGLQSLYNNLNGNNNTAVGYNSLYDNTSGLNNIALGYYAGLYVSTGSSNIDIGSFGATTDTNTIRIGSAQTKTFIAGISGVTVASGVTVVVNSSGQLGITSSSKKFKQNIQSMADTSDVLLALRPVTFKYKSDLDPQGIPQFGLVAEEVDKVDPDLVARDDKNQIYTVRYEAVNAMLLNEFLKQHQKFEEQKTELETLKVRTAKMDSLEKQLQELEATVKSLAEKK